MEKLYEQDALLSSFTAHVTACQAGRRGYEITLDRTAFYPEGGGQPWDEGTLNGIPVTEVHKREGDIVHHCQEPLQVGQQVQGEIDFKRRFDLMQQHSGEHIVSGLAHAMFGCDNVGFHLGSDMVSIDLNVSLTPQQVTALEAAANQYIWENHPVCITYPTPEELETLDYRSKLELSGDVRIVSFPGGDTCACCGTHVASSGQIGLVKLISCQTFRSGVRIELLCGHRAFDYLSGMFEVNRTVSNLLSAKPFETDAAVQRVLQEQQRLKTRLGELENRVFSTIAQTYSGASDVVHFEPDLSPDSLRRLTDSILSHCQGYTACFSGNDVEGYKYALGQHAGDLRAYTKSLNEALRGRGGGKPQFVQGSVSATRREIEAFFETTKPPSCL